MIHKIFDNIEFDGIEYDEDMLFSPDLAKAFLDKSLSRNANDTSLKLMDAKVDISRKSIRKYDNRLISKEDFSNVISVLRQIKIGKTIKYSYPSAGGLYPIDIYVCIKEGRIEGYKEGIYKYDEINHGLRLLNENIVDVKAHYFNNREIYNSSAFSLQFFYRPDMSYPKYGGMGLFYGILDTGIILEKLTDAAHKNNMGSCIIGDINFEKVDSSYVDNNSIYLVCMEVGYVDEDNEQL